MVQDYFNHPLLREHKVKFRQYQRDILEKVLYKNSLIVVPTSLGKTIVTLLLCVDILYNWRKSKILILAPTRPLVHQHLELFKNYTLFSGKCFALTGKISPEIRKTIWRSDSIRIYFATPELVRNDLNDRLLKRDEFYLVVFDEAHRAVKDYSYTYISKKFYENTDLNKNPMILALSASPGSTEEKIKEICTNLFIEQIVVKSEHDTDVLPYIYKVDTQHCKVEIDDFHKEISKIIEYLIQEKITWLIDNKFIKKKKYEYVYRRDLLQLGDSLKNALKSETHNFTLFTALKYQTMAMILLFCRDLVESQGSSSLRKFFNKFKDNIPSKTYYELLSDQRIKKIIDLLEGNDATIHPKLEKVLSIVEQFLGSMKEKVIQEKNIIGDNTPASDLYCAEDNSNTNFVQKKVLIFSQYRDTLEEITDLLNENDISCKGFFGQSNKNGHKGINQDEQLCILNEFKQGVFPVLVATSVAEEGLNIPNVDLVIFYEPVPSEIRFIQRKGRTGRFSEGNVIVLISNDSIDSTYLEISQKKIARMKISLNNVNHNLNHYVKRSFDTLEKMKVSEIPASVTRDGMDKIDDDYTHDVNFDPILDSIASNSNRKIKYFMKKLSYRNKNAEVESPNGYSQDNLQHLYEISLNLDKQKVIGKIQRQIHDLLAKSGKTGLEVSYIQEVISFDESLIQKAISNLEKLKRIVWLNKKTIALVESTKFILGQKYSISIEKVLYGKAIVIVNDKWYASLNHYDFHGPRTLIKKGNVFNVIGEIHKKNGKLHLLVKKII